MDLTTALILFAAAALVAAAIWLTRRRPSEDPSDATALERLQALERQVATLRDEKSAVEKQLAAAQERANRVADLEKKLEDERSATNALHAQHAAAILRAAEEKAASEKRSEATIAALQAKLDEQKKQAESERQLLDDAKARLSEQFRLVADGIMKQHGEQFTLSNKTQIEGLLGPLGEQIKLFQANFLHLQTETVKERQSLVEQVKQLSDKSATMAAEANALTRALRGKSQAQGAWGEFVLSKLLEDSGLREGEEYVTQESIKGAEGARLRPDVVVNLPENRRLVIDSKVSLTAFTEYVAAVDDATRQEQLAKHVASMKGHIKGLASKEYQSHVGPGLDYVIMFVPIEGALAAAMEADPSLTAFAAEQNVAIATPTTLMIALRTVENVWRIERRNQNAEKIADRAGKLYDKFVGFVADFERVGERLAGAKKEYDAALGKLSTGNGNLVRQAEQLRELGAKTSKSMPPALLDEAGVSAGEGGRAPSVG